VVERANGLLDRWSLLLPPVRHHVPVSHVDRDHHRVRHAIDALGYEARIECGCRPEDRARSPVLERRLDSSERAEAAAELHGHGDAPADVLHNASVRPVASRRVQVHDVDAPGAVRLEAPGHLRRLLLIDGLGVDVAAKQADAAPLSQVDCGDDDHDPASSTNAS
jgi:hypothetical protein